MNFILSKILKIMDKRGYAVFVNDSKDYNLNLVGIRSITSTPNNFDDWLIVFWKRNEEWQVKEYKITTDPGLYYLKHLINKNGTAILKEGQYSGLWQIGLHRGKYTALVQKNNCTVIRDPDMDNLLDYDSAKEETGNFGINLHRAYEKGETKFVDAYSAGCQVFANINDFNEFIDIAQRAAKNWGNSFTYALINERDFKEA